MDREDLRRNWEEWVSLHTLIIFVFDLDDLVGAVSEGPFAELEVTGSILPLLWGRRE